MPGRRLQAAIVAAILAASPAPAPAGAPFDARIIQSGHSLTDPIPDALARLVLLGGGRAGRRAVIDRSTIPGSPMDWRWSHVVAPPLPDARLRIGDYDVLVITERVPLSVTAPFHDSERMALRWFEHAWREGRGGAGAETILYATWADVDSGPDRPNPHGDPEGGLPFRERLPLEMARWERILDFVNANRPEGSPPMRMIPGPLILARVHDLVAEGAAPGLRSVSDLFSDAIHLNRAGVYLVALAHYAVIYGRDPRELPDRAEGLGATQAAWMQAVVWEVVSAYPGAGLDPPS